MEEILAKIIEKAPDALIYLKKEILDAFGPPGLIIEIAIFMGLVVLSVIKIIKILFKLVLYIIIPVLLAYFIMQQIDPKFTLLVVSATITLFSKFLFGKASSS